MLQHQVATEVIVKCLSFRVKQSYRFANYFKGVHINYIIVEKSITFSDDGRVFPDRIINS